MATYYGVNQTKAKTPTGQNILDSGVLKGRVRCMMDTYEAAAEAAGSIIEMGEELPKGARILDVILHTDNLDNNATLAVGDYEDNDRYIDAVDHGAGAELQTEMGIGNIAGFLYEVDETYTGKTVGSGTDRQITITTGVAVVTGTIKLLVLYTQD